MKNKTTIEEIKELIEADVFLTTSQASKFLNISARTLEKYRLTAMGGGPSFVKYGRAVRYPPSELMSWRNERLMNNTSEYSNTKKYDPTSHHEIHGEDTCNE